MSNSNADADGKTWTTRRVDLNGHGLDTVWGYVAEVSLTHWRSGPHGKQPTGSEKVGQYAFARLDHAEGYADDVRGDRSGLAVDGTPVIYIGDSFGKHYFRAHGHESVPVDVFEALRDQGKTLVAGVDGGWANWDGRPEWSTTYLDYSDAEVVDFDALIRERREDE